MKLIILFGIVIVSLTHRVNAQPQWPFFSLAPPSPAPAAANLPELPVVAFTGFDNFATGIANLLGKSFANNMYNMLMGRGIPGGTQGPYQPNAIPPRNPGIQPAATLQPNFGSAAAAPVQPGAAAPLQTGAAVPNPWNIPPYSAGFQNIATPFPVYGPSTQAPAPNAQPIPATNGQTASVPNGKPISASNQLAAIAAIAQSFKPPSAPNGQFAPPANGQAASVPNGLINPATSELASAFLQPISAAGAQLASAVNGQSTPAANNPATSNAGVTQHVIQNSTTAGIEADPTLASNDSDDA